MTPEEYGEEMAADSPVSPSQAWRELVSTGFRSRFGLVALAVMVALTIWNFARGSAAIGWACLAVIAFVYLRVPWAVALAIHGRRHRKF